MRIRVGELRQLVREGASPVSGYDPEEFELLGSFNQMKDYLDERADLIDTGAGRMVYDIGDGEALKLAFNSNGRSQNRKESGVSKCAALNAPIVRVRASDPHSFWVVCDLVEPLTGARLNAAVKGTVGLKTVDDLKYAVDAALHPEDAEPRDIDVHERLYPNNEWYTALVDTMVSCKLNPMELHEGNWGLDENGDLVLLDTGG